MRFNSKAHMAQELMSGKRFADDIDVIVYYDEKLPNPFRYGSNEMNGIWDDYNKDVWTEVKPRHVHQDLIDSYQEGQLWQFKGPNQKDWDSVLISKPRWCPSSNYRLHPHNDLIQAHRNGAKIQYYGMEGWTDVLSPNWDTDTQYRIKPATKIVYEWMYKHKSSNNWFIVQMMMDEERAKTELTKYEYRKTGRSWEVEV